MAWWLWVLLGLLLLVVELLTPGGFVALFFGVSALVVGVTTGLGVTQATWLQWILFSCLAVVTLALLRKPLQARLNIGTTGKSMDSLVDAQATVTETIPGGAAGRVELRGSTWVARSRTTTDIKAGTTCRVERVEGLTVWVSTDETT